MQVAAEVFERGKQGGQFMLRIQAAQFLQTAAEKVGIDGIELFIHGRLTF
jgi:hypothetical protein